MTQQRLPLSFLSPNSLNIPPVIDLTNEKDKTSKPASKPPVKPAPQKRGTKRAADEAPAIDPRKIMDDDSGEDGMITIKDSCNQIRAKIRRVIDNNEMTIKDFCDAIHVGQGSYRGFMGQNGPHKGVQSDTYVRAAAYFQKREQLGLKLPTKRRKTTETDKERNGEQAGQKSANGTTKVAAEPATEGDMNLVNITLDGEETGTVPIYETCDMVRKKINDLLRKSDVTGAAFCRLLESQLLGDSSKKIQSAQLSSFRNKKGVRAGNTSHTFYAAYIFFEKMRIQQQKPKSEDRNIMEEFWMSEGGFSRRPYHGFWCRQGTVPVEDKYGRVTFHRNGRF